MFEALKVLRNQEDASTAFGIISPMGLVGGLNGIHDAGVANGPRDRVGAGVEQAIPAAGAVEVSCVAQIPHVSRWQDR